MGFYESGLASLLCWLRIVNAGWFDSIWSEIFLQMKFIFFQGCLIKQVVFLPGQLAPYIQPLLLVPECYFALNVGARVLKFKIHFSQNAVFIGCNIFFSSFGYQIEFIYFHLAVSNLTFWKPNDLSKHLKGQKVIGLHLSTSPKLAVKWIILKWY